MYNQLKNSQSQFAKTSSPRYTINSNSSRKSSFKVKLPKNSKLAPFFSPKKHDPELIIEGHRKILHPSSSQSRISGKSQMNQKNIENLSINSRVQSQRENQHSRKDLFEDNSKTRSRLTIMEQYGFPLENQNKKKTYMSPKTPKIIPLKILHKKQRSSQDKKKNRLKTQQAKVNKGYQFSQKPLEYTFGLQDCFTVKKL